MFLNLESEDGEIFQMKCKSMCEIFSVIHKSEVFTSQNSHLALIVILRLGFDLRRGEYNPSDIYN